FKPANVFLDEDDAGRVTAVVCDFGVAKMLDDGGTLTASGAILGTPIYMAPEQMLDSKHVDATCDVGALGMSLYHARGGRAAPAPRPPPGDLVAAPAGGAPPPLQADAPWISGDLARAVHAMLLPRAQRTPSIAEAAAALRRFAPRETQIT